MPMFSGCTPILQKNGVKNVEGQDQSKKRLKTTGPRNNKFP